MNDMSGTDWTTLGGPGYGSGVKQFDDPNGVAVDTSGYIYVADSGNNRVVRMNNMIGRAGPSSVAPAAVSISSTIPTE